MSANERAGFLSCWFRLEFDKVDILFTQESGRRREAALKSALQLLDDGKDRNEIESATGASFTGRIVTLTVAGVESNCPSFTLNVKLSCPLKSGFGV